MCGGGVFCEVNCPVEYRGECPDCDGAGEVPDDDQNDEQDEERK